MRGSKAWVCLVVTMAACASRALADGMVTHTVIANRAAYYYSLNPDAPGADLIRKYPDAFYSGAIFPDWGFVTRIGGTGHINHDAGEDAHWTPFMKAAAAYIRSKPRPWDEATQKLAAFFLGVLVHDSSDISWHNQGCHNPTPPEDPLGFLQAMASRDFAKDYSPVGIDTKLSPPPPPERTAHSVGDPGGDALAAYRYPLTFLPQTAWYPVDDLVEIYRRYDPKLEVTKEQLLDALPIQQTYIAAFRQADGGAALRRIMAAYYQANAFWSPFLVDRYDDYSFGGVQDAAIVSELRWPVLLQWFETPPREGAFSKRTDLFCLDGGTNASGTDPSSDGPRPSLSYDAAAFPVPATAADRKILAGELARIRKEITISFHDGDEVLTMPAAPSEASSVEGTSWPRTALPFAFAGTSLAVSRGNRQPGRVANGDFNRDWIDDLVIGAPGVSSANRPSAGAVYIYFGRAQADATPRDPDITIPSPDSYSRFGASVAVLDFNGDGVDDLVVGAPLYGAANPTGRARGRVYIFLGKKDGTGVSTTPDIIIEGPHAFANFGSVLLAADCDGDGRDDLIVGSPLTGAGIRQNGNVAIWLSNVRRHPGTLGAPDWTAQGERPADGFGSALAVTRRPDGRRMLLVGAPEAKRDENQGSGKIYGYDLRALRQSPVVNPRPEFTISASARFAHFGASLASGHPRGARSELVAIGAPTIGEGSPPELWAQTGAVFVLSTDELVGDVTLASLRPDVRINGDQKYGRFGWNVSFADLNGDGFDDLIVSEPLRVAEAGADSGMVYIWRGGAQFPTGTARATSAEWKWPGGVRRAQYGRSFTPLDIANPKAKPKLAVASPYDATGAPLAGSVSVRQLP